jgi:hypothetical protein
MSREKALAVAHGDLQLRCPSCPAIIEITEPLASVMLKVPLQKAVSTISSVLHRTFKDTRHRSARSEPIQPVVDKPPAGGLGVMPPIQSPPNQNSNSAESRQ